MKYDIFISYSRKDSKIADMICSALDHAGITYFIDRQGIAGGMEFPAVLADAIAGSRIFLLLASENSYESPYTNKEIYFAFNCKCMMLPYIIDGSKLPMRLQFTFADINWRTIQEHPVRPVLVNDLMQLLGKKTASSKPSFAGGSNVISAGSPGVIKIWNSKTGRCVDTIGHDGVKYKSAVYSPDGENILAYLYNRQSANFEYHVLDSKTGDILFEILPDNKERFQDGAVFTKDGCDIVICCENAKDLSLRICGRTGNLKKTVSLISGAYAYFKCFSPDGGMVAVIIDYTPHVYAVESGRLLSKLERGSYESLAFGNDGKTILTGGLYGSIKIWKVSNGLLLDTLAQDRDAYCINSMAYSPDDKLVASGAYGVFRLWNIETGECLHTLYGEDMEQVKNTDVKSVSFSPDGKKIVFTAALKVCVLDAGDASLVAEMKGHTESGIKASFSPD